MQTFARTLLFLCAAPLLASLAGAQTNLFVNDFRDLPDADLLDLQPDADLALPGVQVTLRSALEFANYQGGNWIVHLPAGVFALDRVGTEDQCRWGDLDVFGGGLGSLEVRGVSAQSVIDAAPLTALGGPDRVLDVRSTLSPLTQVTLRDVVLRSGAVLGNGGGVRLEGGRLSLVGVFVQDCSAYNGGGLWIDAPFDMTGGHVNDCTASTAAQATAIGRGGGVYVDAPAQPDFLLAQIDGNRADQRGGGVYVAVGASADFTECLIDGNSLGLANGGSGGGVANFGLLTLVECSVAGNQANQGTGGGVLVSGSTNGKFERTSFTQNQAGTGGGLATANSASGIVDECTFFGNTAANLGGGWNHSSPSNALLTRSTFQANQSQRGGAMHVFGPLQVSNCTLSGNTALEGGGFLFASGTSEVLDCTIAFNQADLGGGVRIDSSLGNPQVELNNSILAANLDGIGLPQNFAGSPGFAQALRNLDSDGSTGISPFSNIVGLNGYVVDAKLLPLTYLGITATHALAPDSPAIGSGVCLSSADQNGTPRTPPCDLGAVESNLKIPWITTYCTSKTTTIPGCLAKLAGFGLPLVSTPQNFSILCSDVPGNNPGIFFWGLGGPASTPFAGGFLCIAGTIKRSGLLPATGNTGVCNGSFWFGGQGFGGDWVQGQTIWTQCWFRDPGGILSSAFSDALSVTVL